MATTSTLMPLLLKMSKMLAMKPTCPSILVLTMSSRVMPGFRTMLVIKASFMSRSSDISVPAAALQKTGKDSSNCDSFARLTCSHEKTLSCFLPATCHRCLFSVFHLMNRIQPETCGTYHMFQATLCHEGRAKPRSHCR